jgi:predicted adenine nucleotide alpha hydrolase (AANH) superfamily ATPase
LTAQRAALGGFDYFATTLSISPHKDAALLHALALESQRTLALESQHALALPLDLKKRGGFARSVELSRELNLYRQRYCGCLAGK